MLMNRGDRQPGGNIRRLSFRRRVAACYSFTVASVLGILPFLYQNLADRLIAVATFASTPSAPNASIPLVREVYILLWSGAIAFGFQGMWLWKRANHARQGATGEEAIARILNPLRQEGWQFEYNVLLSNRQGDIDILGISPRGQIFAIDAKSHKGSVIFQDNRLRRVYGSESYEFEKDFLGSAMRQALLIREQRKLSFVTPVLVFSNAVVDVPSPKLRGVYLVNQLGLLPLLRKLG